MIVTGGPGSSVPPAVLAGLVQVEPVHVVLDGGHLEPAGGQRRDQLFHKGGLARSGIPDDRDDGDLGRFRVCMETPADGFAPELTQQEESGKAECGKIGLRQPRFPFGNPIPISRDDEENRRSLQSKRAFPNRVWNEKVKGCERRKALGRPYSTFRLSTSSASMPRASILSRRAARPSSRSRGGRCGPGQGCG